MGGSLGGRAALFREGATVTGISPTGPFLAALFGGVLVLSNGIVLWFISPFLSTFPPTPLSSFVALIAIIEGLAGIALILLATGLFLEPKRAALYGWTILAFSLVSLLGGGGFLLGAIAGLLGGFGAFFVQPRAVPARTSPSLPFD